MKKKVGKNNHRTPAALGPRSAVLELSNALARTAFFLAALSPREFHRATEAGSLIRTLATPKNDIRPILYHKIVH